MDLTSIGIIGGLIGTLIAGLSYSKKSKVEFEERLEIRVRREAELRGDYNFLRDKYEALHKQVAELIDETEVQYASNDRKFAVIFTQIELIKGFLGKS